jgi:hypothetical protein
MGWSDQYMAYHALRAATSRSRTCTKPASSPLSPGQFRNEPEVNPEWLISAVFALLAEHSTAGEVEGIKKALPDEIRTPLA